jgi:Domain of unknown function (DUF5753)
VTESTWWQRFADVIPSWFTTYLTHEPTASVIRTYEDRFVPGLFQTAAYARAVIGLTYTDAEDIDRRVDLCQARQRLLDQAAPPDVQAVIVETALTQPPMTPSQKRAQLDRLIALTERPNITIVIVAPTTDGLPVAGSSFTVLHFTDPARADIVYIEQSDDAWYLDNPADIARYSGIMDDLSASRKTPEETRAALRQIRARV